MARHFSRIPSSRAVLHAAACAALLASGSARAATIWDAETGFSWWFNSMNWNANSNDNTTMPNTGTQAAMATEINNGWDFLGEGVVYDPVNDPNFTGTGTRVDPYSLATFYLGNQGTSNNKFTLKSGTVDVNTGSNGANIIARNTVGMTSIFVQTGGMYKNTSNAGVGGSLQLAATTNATGIYEYHGGSMEVCLNAPGSGTGSGNGIRLGQGGSGAVGKFVVYNDGPAGHIRAGNFHVAFGAGTTGIVEYHLNNPATSGNFGVRPIQAVQQISLRNVPGSQQARLDLQLDDAPTVDGFGVPSNLGLADYNTLNSATGQPNTDYFYDITGTNTLPTGTNVTFVHGKTYYTWQIKYHGTINWSDANNSQISSINDGGGLGTDIVLIGQGSVLGSQWTSGSDNWGNAGSWSAGTPNGAGAIANFLTVPGSATTVTANAAFTAGHINLENTNGYTISGANTVTLDVASGNAFVNVYSGNHTISAPLALADNTKLNVAAGSSVTISNIQPAANVNITKTGAGTAAVNNIRVPVATVSAGTLKAIEQANPYDVASEAGTSKVTKLNAATGLLDVTNTKIITQDASIPTTPVYDGVNDIYTYSGVHGLVQKGRGDGSWNGTSGITTSQTDATTGVLTSVAVGTGAELRGLGPTATELFAGQTINGTSTVVMYTYGGDADMDGDLDGDDYFYLDSNVLQSETVFGWHQGDFNYDGRLNGDDYFILDSNILQAQASGNVFWVRPPEFSAGGIQAVPEPASIGLLAVAGGALLHRRRKR